MMAEFELDYLRLQMVLRAAAGDPEGTLQAPPNGQFAELLLLQESLGHGASELIRETTPTPERLLLINQYLGRAVRGLKPLNRLAISRALSLASMAVLPPEIVAGPAVAKPAMVHSLVETGCVDLGRSLNEHQLQDVHENLNKCSIHVGHVPEKTSSIVSTLEEIPADKNYGCYDMLEFISTPHIYDLALRDDILDLAQQYLGCPPTLYHMNAFWSLPLRRPHPYTQQYHRDYEDFKSLSYFTMLTPIESPDDGLHYYVEKSHDGVRFEKALREDHVKTNLDCLTEGPFVAPMAMRLFRRTSKVFQGPAGSSFGTDAYGLHRALVPRSRNRLLMWIRFGMFYNQGYYSFVTNSTDRAKAQRLLDRIPNTPRHRYIFRYLIDVLSQI